MEKKLAEIEELMKEATRRFHKKKVALYLQTRTTLEKYGEKTALDELKRIQNDFNKRPPSVERFEIMEGINALKKIIK
jgi:tyrosyl-tRNA synthetase